MKTIRYAPLAESDLDQIWEYIAQDDPDIAANFIRELMQKISRLSEQPEIGRIRADLLPNLRLFPYRRYLLFYIPIENGIEIIRILHSARDVESQFEM